jgi:hypothetical protein
MGSIHKPRRGRIFLPTYGECKKKTRPWQSPFWTNIDFPKYDFLLVYSNTSLPFEGYR